MKNYSGSPLEAITKLVLHTYAKRGILKIGDDQSPIRVGIASSGHIKSRRIGPENRRTALF